MTLLLDTRQIEPSDAGDTVHDMFAAATVPLDVAFDSRAPLIMEGAWIGSASLLSVSANDLRLNRSERQTQESVAFAVQRKGVAWFEDARGQRQVTPESGLFMTDQTMPYRFRADGMSASCSFEIEYHQLGLPVDVARRAGERLGSSPLYQVVTNELTGLFHDLSRIETDPVAADVIGATTDLIRALVASAADVNRHARSARDDALLPLILAYARQHLSDPGLTPERLARDHRISVRHLNRLCAAADVPLMEWIWEQRLDGARCEMSRRRGSLSCVTAVAHRWGFEDAGDFAGRFKRHYGVTSIEWQAWLGTECDDEGSGHF